MRIEDLPRTRISHLVLSSHLNHHRTLLAGRVAEWVVEAAFIGAESALDVDPTYLVYPRIHGLIFTRGAEISRGPRGADQHHDVSRYAHPAIAGDQPWTVS